MSDLDERLNAAIAIHRQGRRSEAETVYRAIVAADPDHADARHMLGVALLQGGDPEGAEAEITRAVALSPTAAKFHNNLGNAILAQGRRPDAAAAFARALELDPSFADAAFNLATVNLGLGHAARAVAILTDIAEKVPENADVFINLIAALLRDGRVEEARQWCRRGVRRHRDNGILAANYANILEMQDRLVDAEEAARKAVELDSEAAWNRTVLARILRRRGALDEARAHLETVLASGADAAQSVDAEHELGIVLDAVGDTRGAFRAFSAANQRIAATPEAARCTPDRLFDKVRRNKAWFTSQGIRDVMVRAADTAAKAPVFIVGFPCSGVDVLESTFKAHPGLATTSKQSPLWAMEAEVARRFPGGFPDGLAGVDRPGATELRAVFWSEAEKICGEMGGRVMVDMVPLNIVDLGFVNAIFPSARAIVVIRDPRDVCLGCFKQQFRLTDQMANFLDLRRTAETYAAVMDLWLHYRTALTIPWIECRYEDLVADLNGTMARLLDVFGVRSHPGKVKLDSMPVGRWREYAEDLEPVYATLSPYIHEFGYGDS